MARVRAEAHAVRALLGQGLSQYVVAERLGVSQAWVSRRNKFLDLPFPMQRLVEAEVLGLQAALGYSRPHGYYADPDNPRRPYRRRASISADSPASVRAWAELVGPELVTAIREVFHGTPTRRQKALIAEWVRASIMRGTPAIIRSPERPAKHTYVLTPDGYREVS